MKLIKERSSSSNLFPFVSIIVLNYNGKHFLKNCFLSLQLTNYPKASYEVLLIDNGSKDGSAEYVAKEFPWVRIVVLEQNFGFGGGNNRGVKFAKGEYIAFLNNDTEVTEDWLSELVQASIDYSIPICSSKTLFMENHRLIDYSGGKFAINGRGYSIAFRKADDGKTECSFTGYPCATSMLIKADIFNRLGGFDEDYFACLDDTDLGWRAWLLGHKTLSCPASVVYHEVGGTAGKGRLSPLKAFHGTKDPIITILKNLELKNIFSGILLELSYDLAEVFLLLKSGNLECVKMKVKAYSWLFKNLSHILKKRHLIQSKRVISDHWLQNMHFMASSSEAFQEYIRLNSLFPQA